jgi:hypothetical protein
VCLPVFRLNFCASNNFDLGALVQLHRFMPKIFHWFCCGLIYACLSG